MPIGPWELVVILIILVIIFGASRLSQVGGAVGKSIREFRAAAHEEPVAPPAPVSVPQVTCPTCEASSPAGQKFCGKCGTPLTASPPSEIISPAPAENTCPSCATVNPASQVFCGQCGARLTRAA